MATYITLAIVDEVNACDCCGKQNLKSTVAMERDDGEVVYFGSVCATRHSGRDAAVIRAEAQAVFSKKVDAAKAEYKNHPARHALDALITQANRENIAPGKSYRNFLGDTVAADRQALFEINQKHGTFIQGT